MNFRILAIALVMFGVSSRLLPHFPNVVPITAITLLGSVYLPKKLFFLPLIILFISDFFIGFYGTDMFYVYGSYLLTALIGLWLKEHNEIGTVIETSIFSSVLFFLITNFGVWAPPNNWYLHNFAGLLNCYEMALPFFRNSLIADVGYTIILFVGYDLIQNLSLKYLPKKLFRLVF